MPVLMLTGLGEEADRIAGLALRANDYLPKTYSMRELLARPRAVLRRPARMGKAEPAPTVLRIGELEICVDARSVTMRKEPVALTPAEYALLYALARSAGRVKTREQLLLEVGDRDFEAFDRSIDIPI